MCAQRSALRSSGLLFLSIITGPAVAQPLALVETGNGISAMFDNLERRQQDMLRLRPDVGTPQQPAVQVPINTDARLPPQVVVYTGHERPGTVIVDTPNTYLYVVLGAGRALRYGIGVGRDGFTWSGTQAVSRKAEWPEWSPPPEMIARQPYLPRWMAGGPGNPLGARALYLGNTAYRIHGTNDPSTIGKRVSSGCIRMTNEDIIDLYGRVGIGSKVVVLPDTRRHVAADAHRTAIDAATTATPTDVRLARNPATSGLY
jgi:lipoprotein-anchoring transpeptidase ErfK/SrfK